MHALRRQAAACHAPGNMDFRSFSLRAQNAMEGWAGFTQDMRQYYGVDMGCLNEEYRREQQEYFLETSAWADVHPSQLLGSPACFKRYDLLTVTLEEVAAPLKARHPSKPSFAKLACTESFPCMQINLDLHHSPPGCLHGVLVAAGLCSHMQA